MLIQSAGRHRLVIVRLDTGDDIALSLHEAIRKANLRHGLVLGSIGSVNCYHVHVVATSELPARDAFIRGEGPFDIQSLQGMVIDGRLHAHITLANAEKAVGGHLEEGCRILTFGMMILADIPQLDLTDWDRAGQLLPASLIETF